MRSNDIEIGNDYVRKGPGGQLPERVRVIERVNGRSVLVALVGESGRVRATRFPVPTSQIVEPYVDDKPAAMRLRTVRFPDDLWNDAQRIAGERDDNISEMLRATLARYVKRHSNA